MLVVGFGCGLYSNFKNSSSMNKDEKKDQIFGLVVD